MGAHEYGVSRLCEAACLSIAIEEVLLRSSGREIDDRRRRERVS
jgi:hypothetical protein